MPKKIKATKLPKQANTLKKIAHTKNSLELKKLVTKGKLKAMILMVSDENSCGLVCEGSVGEISNLFSGTIFSDPQFETAITFALLKTINN